MKPNKKEKDGKDLTTKEAFAGYPKWFRPKNKDNFYPGSELYKQHIMNRKG